MRSRFDQSLKEINDELITMGGLLEEALSKVIEVLMFPKNETVEEIKTLEKEVDDLEHSIESKSLKLLCFQQPVARDLRAVSTALNMITDMERIADQAVDIAEISIFFQDKTLIKKPEHIIEMVHHCIKMVGKSIDAFVKKDIALAQSVIQSDDEVDQLFVYVKDELIELINKDKKNGEQAIDFIMIAKYLERIADHAVNIAEWVIFNETGEHKNNQIL